MKFHVEIWGYCLMPNHVHLIAVPETQEALGQAIGRAHWAYTKKVNERENWTGHLMQGSFSSYPMDERHLLAAARYIELNPVRAGLVGDPAGWPWSSARSHLSGKPDPLVDPEPLLSMAGDWRGFLKEHTPAIEAIRKHQATGRPLGDEAFVSKCEQVLGRMLKRKKPGPKPQVN
jgi:putative transposase